MIVFIKIKNKISNNLDKRILYGLKHTSLNNENGTKNILEIICKFINFFSEEVDSFETFDVEI